MRIFNHRKKKKMVSLFVILTLFTFMFANLIVPSTVHAMLGVTVDEVLEAYLGENRIELDGSGFLSIDPGTVTGAVYNQNTGETIAINSAEIFEDSSMDIILNQYFSVPGQYTLSIAIDGTLLDIYDNSFTIYPPMGVQVEDPYTSITITESVYGSMNGEYGWSSGDPVTVSLFKELEGEFYGEEDLSNLIQSTQTTDTTILLNLSQALTDGEYFIEVEKTVGLDHIKIGEVDFEIITNGITGTVIAPDGVTPVGNGFVEVFQSNEPIKMVDVDIDGTFIIGGLSDGTYKLRAKPPWESNYCASEVEITISGGTLISPPGELNIQLVEAQFMGIVKSPDQIAIGNGNVEIFRESGEWIDSVHVRNDGTFLVGGLGDGRYELRARPPEGSSYASSEVVIVEITGGQLVGTEPVLVLSAPQIVGQAFEPDGVTALQYGFVEVRDVTGKYVPGAEIDQQGYFRIGGLSDGDYILRAIQWGSSYSPSEEITVTITNGQYSGGNLNLLLTTPQITGTVENPDHSVAQDAWVDIIAPDGRFIDGVSANQEGIFNIGGLVDGTYRLKAKPSWQDKLHADSQEVEITITNGQYTGNPVVLTLSDPQVSGSVHIPAADGGTKVDHGFIDLRKNDGTWMPGVGIQNGDFAIGGLADGVYIIQANPDWNSNYTKSPEFSFRIQGGVLVVDPALDYTGGPVALYLRGSQLVGTVLDPDGNPNRFGWVDVKSKTGEWLTGSSVDGNGQFRIGGLVNGTYQLTAWPGPGSQYAESEDVTIVIVDGQYSGDPVVLTLRAPQIAGEVVSPDGTPEAFGYIEIKNAAGMHVGGTGVNELGYFSIGGLADGTYFLKANPGWDSEYSASGEVKIQVVNGVSSESSIVFVLKSAQVTGHVFAPDGVTPINNGYVSVEMDGGRWVTGAPVSNGEFRIGSLEPGTYSIIAFPDWNSDYGESTRVTFTINENGQSTNNPLTILLTEPQVTGVVVGPAGTNDQAIPQPFGFVEIRTQQDMWMPGTGINHEGEFRISGLEPGTYIIKAIPNGEGSYSASNEVTIVIDENGNYTGNNPLYVSLTTAQINGTVKDPNGNNALFGYSEVFNEEGMWVMGAPVDRNGQFRIGNLKDGTYYLRVQPDSMNSDFSASQPIEIVISGGTCITDQGQGSGNITVTLSNSQVSGTVRTPGTNGSAAQHGWIEIQKLQSGNEWNWIGGTGVNWEGQFNVGGLNDGTYRIKAFPDHSNSSYSASQYVEIVIAGGAVTRVDGSTHDGSGIELMLTQPQISGVLQGPNGEQIMFGWVEVRDGLGNFVSGMGAKDDGSFMIGALNDGTYMVTAYPGWTSEFTESESVTVTISNGSYSNNPLTLILKSAQVTGRVTEPDGEAVNWGWVEVFTSNDTWVKSTGIDEHGNFRLSGLEDGNYTVQAFPKPGSEYAPSQKTNITISNGTYNGTLTLSLTNSLITGVVYRPNGDAATGGWVEVGDPNENWLLSVPINKNGTFRLPELEPGQYTIQAFPKEGSPYGDSSVETLTISGDNSYNPNPLELHLTNLQ
ncbi:MAG: MSCRAMM family protein [Bacillota bacterium]